MGINWLGGILGGLLIGSSAVILLLFNGRIAGVSGIASGAFINNDSADRAWRMLFLVGLVIGAGIYSLISGNLQIQIPVNNLTLAFAGLLVGIGTKLGSGCTSGHGVCGIARRSRRSITATFIFMITAILTVFVKQKMGL